MFLQPPALPGMGGERPQEPLISAEKRDARAASVFSLGRHAVTRTSRLAVAYAVSINMGRSRAKRTLRFVQLSEKNAGKKNS